MLLKAGGYSGPPINVFHALTQGYPLYTNICNVVVDALISHWVTVVAPMEAESEVLREII